MASSLPFLLLLLFSAAATADGNSTLTAYEALESFGFPEGLLPEGALGYDLDPSSRHFSAYLSGDCSFSLEGSYQIWYKPTISGVNSPGRITGLQGVTFKILKYLDDRCRIHKETILFCQNVLQRKSIDWETIMRNDLSRPITNKDLVVSVGGDGTLLRASHYMDDTIPIVGVNSDPTQDEQVEESAEEYDATRSTGYLCAATASNFENVLDEILDGFKLPSELSRLSVGINDVRLSVFALNDILVSHPCPASVSRFSFRIISSGQKNTLVNCRSSGLRVCTAAGSTAAMQSAGGIPMPILSTDLQYMVREPISPMATVSHMMHGYIKSDQFIKASWYSKEGFIYVDGCHVFHRIQHGDVLDISVQAPVLKVHLPNHFSG